VPDGRTFVVPASEIYAGDPTRGVLEYEAATGTRLRDGGNPIAFLRVVHRFKNERGGKMENFRQYIEKCPHIQKEAGIIPDKESVEGGDRVGQGAGAAFRMAMESDPAAKSAWERASAKLNEYAKVLREATAGSAEELRQKLKELADAMREGLRASGEELAAQGFTPPESIEDWEHLAHMVEIPFETIRSGNLKAREIHACALAWADRQKMKARFSASASTTSPTKPPANGKPERRSWTQADLDAAIRQYKADRAKSYADLCDAITSGRVGAKKKAQEIYGRNAIARALNVSAPAMVSKSPVWVAIAKELGLPLNRSRTVQGTRHTQRPGKIGHEAAVEEKSATPEEGADNAPAEQQLETAERQETIRLINALARAGKNAKEKIRNEKTATDIHEKLQRDEYTDDQARQIIEMALHPNG
jgi:hypothetical protein